MNTSTLIDANELQRLLTGPKPPVDSDGERRRLPLYPKEAAAESTSTRATKSSAKGGT